MRTHDEVPLNPKDGDRFSCSTCDYEAKFVVLDDGEPGEWVETTPASEKEIQ